jgi:YVTN family beta-propeller protein
MILFNQRDTQMVQWSRHLPALAMALTAGAPFAATGGAPAQAAPSRYVPHYAVQQHWPLGAPSRWDYTEIDPVRHRLFVTRGDRVQVLDLASGQALGEIAGTAGVHGVALAQDLKLGFTSNGRSDSVTVFDLNTLQVRQEFKVNGGNPDTILYEPGTRKLYTFNGRTANVSVFDAATFKPLATIAVGGRPEFAVADGAGRIFVNLADKARIAVLDVHADKLLATWPLNGCDEPSGLALDGAHGRLFSVCANHVMAVTDSAHGKAVARVAIGGHPDAAAYDASSATVFSSNGDGTLSVVHQIDANRYAPALSVPTAKGARTMALDHDSKRVYLPAVVDHAFTVLVAAP